MLNPERVVELME
jgi:hypothetical protein